MATTYCRHIRTSGYRCHSPALRGTALCFFHTGINERHRTLHRGTCNVGEAEPLKLRFPALEDSPSIQVALSMLVAALGDNRLDTARARAMLYALRIAAENTRNLASPPRYSDPGSVSEAVLDDDTGDLIACDRDPDEVLEAQQMMREIDEEIAAEEAEEMED